MSENEKFIKSLNIDRLKEDQITGSIERKMRFERTIYLIAGSLKEWNALNLKIQMKLKWRFMICKG